MGPRRAWCGQQSDEEFFRSNVFSGLACAWGKHRSSILESRSLLRGFIRPRLDAPGLRNRSRIHARLICRCLAPRRNFSVVFSSSSRQHSSVHLHHSTINVCNSVEWRRGVARNVLYAGRSTEGPGLAKVFNRKVCKGFAKLAEKRAEFFCASFAAFLCALCG